MSGSEQEDNVQSVSTTSYSATRTQRDHANTTVFILQPTDSLNRPRELIPPGSPNRLSGYCNGGSGEVIHEHVDTPPEPSLGSRMGSSVEDDMKGTCNVRAATMFCTMLV